MVVQRYVGNPSLVMTTLTSRSAAGSPSVSTDVCDNFVVPFSQSHVGLVSKGNIWLTGILVGIPHYLQS